MVLALKFVFTPNVLKVVAFLEFELEKTAKTQVLCKYTILPRACLEKWVRHVLPLMSK